MRSGSSRALVYVDARLAGKAGFYLSAGTSLATPMLAGIVAIADQTAGHGLGLLNPLLYRLAAAHVPGLVDVTSGKNTVVFPQGGATRKVPGFRAVAGYDLASGLGTVNAARLVPELVSVAPAARPGPR